MEGKMPTGWRKCGRSKFMIIYKGKRLEVDEISGGWYTWVDGAPTFHDDPCETARKAALRAQKLVREQESM